MSKVNHHNSDKSANAISQIEFSVTEEMVGRFSQLSGDFSSLHTDKAFGRRSMYRENVAHGMLVIMFIAGLKELKSLGGGAVLRRISSSFLKPVFVKDKLQLTAEISQEAEKVDTLCVGYKVDNVKSGITVAMGSFGLEKVECSGKDSSLESNVSCESLVETRLVEEKLRFDEINKGDKKEFAFEINDGHLNSLCEMINQGLEPDGQVELCHEGVARGLLATSVLSTFAGMCIPGRYATFLSFQIEFEKPIDLQVRYILEGKVGFKSESASTLVEDISICDAKEPQKKHVTGKMKVKVNPPPIEVPTVKFLKDSYSDLQLKDKVVLITGGSRGIGAATAKLFAVHGAKVVVNYFRGQEDANRIVEDIVQNGGQAIAVQADVSNRDDVKRMILTTGEQYGRLDVLVNNAVKDFTPIAFMDLTWDDIQQEIDITIKGAFNCCQEALPLMLQNEKGSIVNMSTVAVESPPVSQGKYVLAKSGLMGLTRSLAVEFAADNIRVNMVVPGMVETDLTSHISKLQVEGIKKSVPMGRLGSTVDVAKAIVFLASDLASFTTGQKVMVTGGGPVFL